MLFSCLAHDLGPGAPLSYELNTAQQETKEAVVLQHQYREIQNRLSRLRQAYLDGIEEMESYAVCKRQLEKQCVSVKQRLQAINNIQPGTSIEKEINTYLSQCLALLQAPQIGTERKRRALRQILRCCAYDKSQNTLSLTYRLPSIS